MGLRRFISKISIRLLAFNVLLVLLPAAAVSYLEIYESQLLRAQEQSMVQQGRVLAAALSERGPLSGPGVEPILVRLEQRTTSRIRVVDAHALLLSDTSRLGPQREPDETDASAEIGSRQSWLYRVGSYLFRFLEALVTEPRAVVGQEFYSADRPLDGVEVEQALKGNYGAATRITPGGQRSLTLYSAIPVTDEGSVVGAVLVSQSTFQILQDLIEVRLTVFRFLLVAVGFAAILSLLVSTTISRPLKRLRSQAMAILDRRGRITGRFRGLNRLDEIGDLSRALSELSARLEERMRFIESFAADVSHEFKNPLASIRSAAEMLKDVEDPKERARFATMVERDIARLESLLSGVMEISQLDVAAPGSEEESVAVALHEVLVRVLENERRRYPGYNFELALRESSVVVVASPMRIVQIFENLVENAVSFSPKGGLVRVSLDRDGKEALVRVEDEGSGIPQQHRDRIFDRFFSYRPDATRAKEHSGLGLSIVKAILERYGGSIALVDSELGGAGFEVRLRRS